MCYFKFLGYSYNKARRILKLNAKRSNFYSKFFICQFLTKETQKRKKIVFNKCIPSIMTKTYSIAIIKIALISVFLLNLDLLV